MHHETLQLAQVGLMPTRTALILLRGVISLTLGGVAVYINAETEESWMEFAEDTEPLAVTFVMNSLHSLGYELMDEVDAIEERPGGVIRNYLAQTWFPREEEVVMAAS